MTRPASDETSGEGQPSSLVVAFGAGWLSARPRLLAATRLAELAAALVVSLITLHPGRPGATQATWSIGVAGVSWLVWIAAGRHRRVGGAALVAMAAAGGLTYSTRGAGLVLAGIAASSAAAGFSLPTASAMVAPSVGAWAIAASVGASPARPALQLVGVLLFGLVAGTGRRQLLERGRQLALLTTARERLAVAEREAELLAERNRLAREVHDVLAHALGTISIQLTALDSRVAAGDGAPAVRSRIAAIHRLVGEGLEEVRDAVQTVRDDGVSLTDQVTRLCDMHNADLNVDGTQSPLEAAASHALYRTVQEALTNGEKHAPRSQTTVTLVFGSDATTVRIDSVGPLARQASPLADTGAGNGLRGMRERLHLVGGTLDAGPVGGGWRVHATVPRG